MGDFNRDLRALREKAHDIVAAAEAQARALTKAEKAEYDRVAADIAKMERDAQLGEHTRHDADLRQNATGCSLTAIVRHALGDRVDIGRDREWSQEYARRTGMSPKGTFVPLAALRTERRALNTATGSAGGYMVPEMMGDFIEALRPASAVMAAGAMGIEVPAGELVLPKQTGTSTAYWVGESATITESAQTFGQIRLSPHEVAVRTEFTRQLAASAPAVLEQILENDLRNTMATKIDYAAIYGSGVGAEPLGVSGTTGVGAPSEFSAAIPTWTECLNVASEVAVDNALTARCAWVLNPALAMQLRGKSKDAGSGQFVLNGNPGEIAGFRAVESGNVTYTASTATDLWFGDWSQLVVATWGAIDVVVDPYTNAATSGVRLFAYGFVDVGVRQPQAFSKGFYVA